jgi:hypothetical protein
VIAQITAVAWANTRFAPYAFSALVGAILVIAQITAVAWANKYSTP